LPIFDSRVIGFSFWIGQARSKNLIVLLVVLVVVVVVAVVVAVVKVVVVVVGLMWQFVTGIDARMQSWEGVSRSQGWMRVQEGRNAHLHE